MGCCLCIGLAEVTVCCQMLWLCLRHVGEASDTVLVSEHCRSAVLLCEWADVRCRS